MCVLESVNCVWKTEEAVWEEKTGLVCCFRKSNFRVQKMFLFHSFFLSSASFFLFFFFLFLFFHFFGFVHFSFLFLFFIKFSISVPDLCSRVTAVLTSPLHCCTVPIDT